jgi:hypothetical protein
MKKYQNKVATSIRCKYSCIAGKGVMDFPRVILATQVWKVSQLLVFASSMHVRNGVILVAPLRSAHL